MGENQKNYQMNYRFYPGEGEEVIVFIHGIPTNHHLWDPLLPYLERKHSLLMVDLIGYGWSERAPYHDLTLPKQAEYIINLLDHLKISNAHFVGHDLGGGIVQILAINYYNRVKSVVIVDGVCFANWPLPKIVSIRFPTADEYQPSLLMVEDILHEGLFYPQKLKPKLLTDLLAPYYGERGPNELRQASWALDYHQTDDLVPLLPSITCPSTILWGQHDKYLSPYWGLLLHASIPKSEYKILSNCGHYSMIDNPRLFAKELDNHLQRAGVE